MDDDEEEERDNIGRIQSGITPITLVIIKSNMVRETNRQRIVYSKRPKTVHKFPLILLALLFSNFQFWFICAQNINQLNFSRFRSTPTLDDYRDVPYPSTSDVQSGRRIRHDTTKSTANKRLILVEPILNSLPDDDEDESIRNTSTQYLHDEGFKDDLADSFELERLASEQKEENGDEPRILNAIAEKLFSPKYNDNCTCYGGKKKVSTAPHNLTISVQHRVLNTSEGITAGIVYQVIINSVKKLRDVFLSTEDKNGGAPVGLFLPPHKPCSNSVHFFSNKFNGSQILLNWSLPTTSGNSTPSSVVFRLCYQLVEYNHTTAYEVINEFLVLKGCEFRVRSERGNIASSDLFSPPGDFLNCSVIFSNVLPKSTENSRQQGLIVKLTRLNVRCDVGNVAFSFNSSALLCGKLEEISSSNREYYFPPSQPRPHLLLLGKPVFAFTYELVDFCYNVSLTAPNDSVVINPLLKIFCNYKISLPYGYRVNVSLSIRSSALPKLTNFKEFHVYQSNGTVRNRSMMFVPIAVDALEPRCPGVLLRYWDSNNSYVFCEHEVNAPLTYNFNFVTEENTFRFRIVSQNQSEANFYMKYESVEIEEIVGGCGFGSVTINTFCVNVIDDERLEWTKAEQECARQGGHLASILDEQSQHVIDQFLLKSPSYRDHNSYWIGASDIGNEGEFRWADSSPFSYTNWFAGWLLNGYYNRQPNDDGFSSQDCVEIRREYHISRPNIATNSSKVRLTSSFTWNDRDCQTQNYFLCEFLKVPSNPADQLPNFKKTECNQKLSLTQEDDRAVISSPEFPHNYPDNKNCLIQLNAPPSYKIAIVFEEFVLEEETNCSYDYLEMYENTTGVNDTNDDSENVRRFCGDWSDKLKLLRYVSTGPRLFLRFVSDYSHSYSGYKAHISIEQVKTECPDDRQQIFNGSCYLFVSYPQVTWQTALDICSGLQGNLASVHSIEEQQFVVAKIRESHEYTASTIYWLGGKLGARNDWKWVDNTSIIFNAWVPLQVTVKPSNKTETCLGIQWIPSPSAILPSGLYWVPIACQKIGGYVCKINNNASTIKTNLNLTLHGPDGELASPNFPGNYYHNLDYWISIIGPENSRIIIQFQAFDLEEQKDCLYDYLEIYNASSNSIGKPVGSVRHCGHHHTNSLHRLNYVSSSNEAILRFHSDYSIASAGFLARWKAVDISGCPIRTLTAKENTVISPNYPNFLLANLQCTTTILAPVGRQVWFELEEWDFNKRQSLEENSIPESDLYIVLSEKAKLYPLQDPSILSDGVYLSYGEYMKIHLRTGDLPNGRGFKGIYRTISELSETRVINLQNDSYGNVFHLNFPLNPVPGLNFVQRFIAPLGYSIHMLFHQVVPSSLGVKGETICQDEEKKGFIEVRDHYADRNGTWWQFCEVGHPDSLNHLAITSYLNSLTIKQVSNNSKVGITLNASLSVIPDPNFQAKITQFPQDYVVESCSPNPCYNNGKCISDERSKRCECVNHFTGLFCALTICDTNPCVFGQCELTSEYFKCVCQSGYQGKLCDKKIKPCSNNPCEGRGECFEKNNFTFVCQCHAWWEGERCDKKIANIPYKPLTDRMLEEPFWLGLLTVFIVLSVIGLVWCARRHFPEKLEKLLAEEAERNRHYTTTGRAATARAEMVAQNGIATAVNVSQTNTANSSPNPRTLLGRLGIRKPSLFSLTSPLQPTHSARTFSLDDLFKPSSSRSQMSYKHPRGGASQRKKSSEKSFLKKQSSSVDENTLEQGKKVEIIELKEKNPRSTTRENSAENMTTAIGISSAVGEETSFNIPKLDKKSDKKPELSNKYEKKVHFARLMNKVQAEICNSHSDVDIGLLKEEDNGIAFLQNSSVEKPLAASMQTLNYETKSPHSTSSNQGSDSLSSSEMTLITASGEKLNSRRPSLLTLGTNGRCQKAASADSILAMFRKFSLSTGPPSETNSNLVSASTSPTISSPQDDIAGSENSSLSSFHLNAASASNMNESPPCSNKLQSSTIQVSVLDPLNSQNTTNIASSNLLHPPTILLEVPNKCLSPIHEVPTPSPSPLMTPIMSRHYSSSINNDGNNNNKTTTSSSPDSLDANYSSKTSEGITEESPLIPPSSSGKPSIRNSSNLRSLRSLSSSSSTQFSVTLSPPESNNENASCGDGRKSGLVIPTFTIQESSPTVEVPSIVLCPGTPPPDTMTTFLCLREEHRPSLELSTPPTITVTYTGEMDSDPDCSTKRGGNASTATVFLSPFSGCSRADRTASESNLSSSGYSSMASPGPSRCGSNNPLCPSENEDQHSPRRPLPLVRTPSCPDKTTNHNTGQPSDPETLSDDHQMESNDEGFSTDQITEKIKHGDVKSAKELEMFIEKRSVERSDSLDLEFGFFAPMPSRVKVKSSTGSDQYLDSSCKSCAEALPKSSLQLPSIVVEADNPSPTENRSPVSSRSESPLSDRTAGLDRFSPMFYGRMTDSDGVYDWTSSDCIKPMHRKHFGRRRERQRSKSPNVKAKTSLEVPGKPLIAEKCRRPSPKRRARSHLIKASSSSSSSSEGTGSRSKIGLRRLHSPHKGRYSSKSSLCSTTEEVSADDAFEDFHLDSQLRTSEDDDLKKESQVEDFKIPQMQRFNIFGKLSSMLSQEKKPNWKTEEEYSASIPLLVQSHSAEESRSNGEGPSQVYNFRNQKKKHNQHASKRGKSYHYSSGLTD